MIRIGRLLALGATWTAAALQAAPALAQEFAKVDDGAREQLPATPFIGAAYGFIWVAILAYVFFTARRLGRVQGEIQDLRARLDRGGGRSGGGQSG